MDAEALLLKADAVRVDVGHRQALQGMSRSRKRVTRP